MTELFNIREYKENKIRKQEVVLYVCEKGHEEYVNSSWDVGETFRCAKCNFQNYMKIKEK